MIIITGLEVFTQYQAACVAEADGGLLSTQEQIDVTRRRLNTSESALRQHRTGGRGPGRRRLSTFGPGYGGMETALGCKGK